MLRTRYEVTKDLVYEVTKLRDSNATYWENSLWRIVMHYASGDVGVKWPSGTWRHSASLWLHWEVWQYHRSIDKWKGYTLRKRYEVTKKVRSYEKGTKLRRGTKLRKGYEVKKKVRSYEKDTKLRKGTKMLRNKLRKDLVMKLPSYEIVTPPIGIIYYDVIVMHYGEMPRATLWLSDLRSQVAIFGEWNIYDTRKKSFVKFQTSNAYLKINVQLTKSWKTIKNKLAQIYLHPME